MVMATKNGVIKKTPIDDFQNVRKSGLIAIHLRKDDALVHVNTSTGTDDIVLVSRGGQSIRFKEKDIRAMGRTAAGVRGITLKGDDMVVSMSVLTASMIKKGTLMVIMEKGYGKRTSISLHKVQKRGGSGIKAANTTAKTGPIVAALFLSGAEEEIIAVSRKAQVIRMAIKSIPRLGRSTQGVRVMRLTSGDSVASVTVV